MVAVNVMDAIPKKEFFEIISGIDDDIRSFESQVMPTVYKGVMDLEEYQEQTSHVYGPFNKKSLFDHGSTQDLQH